MTKCCICRRPMIPGGALLVGPQREDKTAVLEHICLECWPVLCKWLENMERVITYPPVMP